MLGTARPEGGALREAIRVNSLRLWDCLLEASTVSCTSQWERDSWSTLCLAIALELARNAEASNVKLSRLKGSSSQLQKDLAGKPSTYDRVASVDSVHIKR